LPWKRAEFRLGLTRGRVGETKFKDIHSGSPPDGRGTGGKGTGSSEKQECARASMTGMEVKAKQKKNRDQVDYWSR